MTQTWNAALWSKQSQCLFQHQAEKNQFSPTVLVLGNQPHSHYAIQATALHCNQLGEPFERGLVSAQRSHTCLQSQGCWSAPGRGSELGALQREAPRDTWFLTTARCLQVKYDCASWFISSGSDLGWLKAVSLWHHWQHEIGLLTMQASYQIHCNLFLMWDAWWGARTALFPTLTSSLYQGKQDEL